jgi:hypothetical protein
MEMNKVEGQLLEELDKKFKKLLEVGDEDAYQLACDLILLDAKEDFVRNVFPEVVTKGYYYGNGWDLDFRGRQYYEEILDALYGGNVCMVFMSDLAYLFFKSNYENYFSEDEINKAILEDPGSWFNILFDEWYYNLGEEEEKEIVSSVIMDDVKKGKVNPLDFFDKVFNYDYVCDTVKSYNHIDWAWLAKRVGQLEQMVELVESKKQILETADEN